MNKIKEFLTKNIDNIGKLIVVVSVFSSFFVSGVFGLTPYGSLFNYPICALLIIYIGLYIVLKGKEIQIKDGFLILIVLLLLCNIITIFLNDGKLFNIKLMIITAMQWLVLFMYVKNHKEFIFKIMDGVVLCSLITTVFSLYSYIFNIATPTGIDRFCGYYANTNMGSCIMVISVALSVLLFQRGSKIFKIGYGVNIVLQFLLIYLCMSRASTIILFIFIFVYLFVYSLLYTKKAILIIRNLGIGLLCTFLVYNYAPLGLYKVHDSVTAYQNKKIAEQNKNITQTQNKSEQNTTEEKPPVKDETKTEPVPIEEKTPTPVAKRDEQGKKASAGYRKEMLKAGFAAIPEKAFFGHGIQQLPTTVKAHATSYLNGVDGGGVHNTYLQVAVANGMLGFLLFMAIQCLLMWKLFKNRKVIFQMHDKQTISQFSAFFALYLALLAYGMFEAILILNSAIVTNMFVIVAGGLRDVK